MVLVCLFVFGFEFCFLFVVCCIVCLLYAGFCIPYVWWCLLLGLLGELCLVTCVGFLVLLI